MQQPSNNQAATVVQLPPFLLIFFSFQDAMQWNNKLTNHITSAIKSELWLSTDYWRKISNSNT